MRRQDFTFDLPDELIAQAPADRRDASRLLVVGEGDCRDRQFPDVVDHIPADAVVVLNDTKVRPARLRAHKQSGGAVELLVLEPAPGGLWRCLARSSKPLRPGMPLAIDGGGPTATVVEPRAPDGTVVVDIPGDIDAVLDAHGELPLPPYIARPDGITAADQDRYQTVYAREPGAVAAPTAGLHFTRALLDRLADRGCTLAYVTLHVGPGTFSPVRVDDLDDHVMHSERFEIPAETAALVDSGRPVVAVGTTSVRALEAAAAGAAGETNLFIRPGYSFRVVDHLVTNFHLPESTLLMLVCAFAGTDRILSAYRHAVAERYRFFSYGDAMFLSRSC